MINDKTKLKAYLAWASICVVWGTTYLAIRIGVSTLPPMLFAGLRWTVAGSLFFMFLYFKGYKLPGKNDIIHSAVIGILLLGVANGLVVIAEQWLPSGLTALLITTVPFWITGIEWILPLGKKINAYIISGLLTGFTGVAIIFWNDILSVYDQSYLLGAVFLLLAVISWSIGTVYSKYKKVNIHPLMGASVQMMIAGSAQLLLALILGEFSNVQIELKGVAALAYLVVFGSFFGYALYIYAIAHLPVSFVSTYAYVNPVIALILGWFILDEKLNAAIGISALIIFIGVTLVKKGNTLLEKRNE